MTRGLDQNAFIDLLYEAVIEPDLWTKVLEGLGDQIGGGPAILTTVGSGHRGRNSAYRPRRLHDGERLSVALRRQKPVAERVPSRRLRRSVEPAGRRGRAGSGPRLFRSQRVLQRLPSSHRRRVEDDLPAESQGQGSFRPRRGPAPGQGTVRRGGGRQGQCDQPSSHPSLRALAQAGDHQCIFRRSDPVDGDVAEGSAGPGRGWNRAALQFPAPRRR